jgi:hypothetical protein
VYIIQFMGSELLTTAPRDQGLETKMKNMGHYAGARADEVFVGNTKTKNGVPEHLRGLTTARLGEQALDIEGKKIAPGYMRPLFVGRAEADAYDRIMTRRTFPGQFR